jgi:hypothetical protein
MSNRSAPLRLWLIIDGPSGAARVVAASQSAPRRGRRVEVTVADAVLETKTLWLLVRKEPADVILAVDLEQAPLEARRAALGKLASQYEVINVPLREKPNSPA